MLYNKNNLIDALVQKEGTTMTKAERIVDTIFNQIKMAVKEGKKVNVAKFGVFEMRDVSSREVRNPKTGELSTYPAHFRVRFRPAQALREFINQK